MGTKKGERVRIHLSYMSESGSLLEAAFKQAGVDPGNRALMATIMALGAVAWSRNLSFAQGRDGLVLVSPAAADPVAAVLGADLGLPRAGVGSEDSGSSQTVEPRAAEQASPQEERPRAQSASRATQDVKRVARPNGGHAAASHASSTKPSSQKAATTTAKPPFPVPQRKEHVDGSDPSETWTPNPAVASIVAGAPNLIDEAVPAPSNDDADGGFAPLLSEMPTMSF